MLKKINTIYKMFCCVLDITPVLFRKRIPALFLVIVLSSLLEVLSVALVVPFIYVVLDADRLLLNPKLSLLLRVFHIQGKYELVLFLAIVLVTVYIVKNLALLMARQYQISFGVDIQKELSTNLLKSYMDRPYVFFLDNNTGYLSARIQGDTNAIYNVLNGFMTILAESMTIFAIGIYISYVDPVMAVGAMMTTVVCIFIVTIGLKNRVSTVGERRFAAYYENGKELMQALAGIKDISVTRRRKHFVDSYKRTYEDRAKGDKLFGFYNMLPERIIEVLFVGSIVLIVAFRMRWGTDMTEYVSRLAAFAMAAYRVLPSISKYAAQFNQLMFSQTALYSGYDAIKEAENYVAEIQSVSGEQKEEKKVFKNELKIRRVIYRYRADVQPIIDDLTLSIKKGEAVGLIGESGAGKSTLADIILGLLTPESGGVFMDEIDIRTIPISWSHNIGYVPQSVFLVDGTVRENIGFGLAKNEIDDETVWSVLEKAKMKSFVEKLDGKLDAMVGERGIKFSGGQRQRIAIARALYNKPSILILDEATSALDNDTEATVMESIESLMGSVTLIIIAHRLTTIRNCNKIYEIVNGKAVERTKQELGIK